MRVSKVLKMKIKYQSAEEARGRLHQVINASSKVSGFRPHTLSLIKNLSRNSCLFCKKFAHEKHSNFGPLINKALKEKYLIPTCFSFGRDIDSILNQVACSAYVDFKETLFEKEDQLHRRLYCLQEIPSKFLLIWKFYQFSIISPKLYRISMFKIVRRNINYKLRKREEIMRAVLEEISDSEIHNLDLDYVADFEKKKKSMLYDYSNKESFKGSMPILNGLKAGKSVPKKRRDNNSRAVQGIIVQVKRRAQKETRLSFLVNYSLIERESNLSEPHSQIQMDCLNDSALNNMDIPDMTLISDTNKKVKTLVRPKKYSAYQSHASNTSDVLTRKGQTEVLLTSSNREIDQVFSGLVGKKLTQNYLKNHARESSSSRKISVFKAPSNIGSKRSIQAESSSKRIEQTSEEKMSRRRFASDRAIPLLTAQTNSFSPMRIKLDKFDQNLGIYDEFQPAYPEHPILYFQEERDPRLLISEYSIKPEELTKSVIESPKFDTKIEPTKIKCRPNKDLQPKKIRKEALTVENSGLVTKNLTSRFQNFPSSRKVAIPTIKAPTIPISIPSKSPADCRLKRSESKKKEKLLFQNKISQFSSRNVFKAKPGLFSRQKMSVELPFKSVVKDKLVLYSQNQMTVLPNKNMNSSKFIQKPETVQNESIRNDVLDDFANVHLTTPKIFTSFNNSSVKGSQNELSYKSRNSSKNADDQAELKIYIDPVTAPSSNLLQVPKVSSKQTSLKHIMSKRQTTLHNSLAQNKLMNPAQDSRLKNIALETASKELTVLKKQAPLMTLQEITQKPKVVDSRVILSKKLIYPPPALSSYATIDSALQRMADKGTGVHGLMKDKKVVGKIIKDVPYTDPKSKPSLKNIEVKNLKNVDKWPKVVSKPLFTKKEHGAFEHRPIYESQQGHEFIGRNKPEQVSLNGHIESLLNQYSHKAKR